MTTTHNGFASSMSNLCDVFEDKSINLVLRDINIPDKTFVLGTTEWHVGKERILPNPVMVQHLTVGVPVILNIGPDPHGYTHFLLKDARDKKLLLVFDSACGADGHFECFVDWTVYTASQRLKGLSTYTHTVDFLFQNREE